MVYSRSTFIRPRSYTLLRRCCTRRAQACYLFANVVLCLILLLTLAILSWTLIRQYEIKQHALNEDIQFERFKNSTFMPFCNYFVSPWFLNLCNIQDIYIGRAWRVYRLFPGQLHTCMNVNEEIPCSESHVKQLGEQDSFPMFKFCPSINQVQVDDKNIARDLKAFFPKKKYPRRPLTSLKGDIVRAVDIIAICPICNMHPVANWTMGDQYPTHLETVRFGWPVTRSKCDPDYEQTRTPIPNGFTTTTMVTTTGNGTHFNDTVPHDEL